MDIIPGKSIGLFKLGMSEDELFNIFEDSYRIEQRANTKVYWSGPAKIWVDNSSGKVTQISMGPGYKGSVNGGIMVGSLLNDIRQSLGKPYAHPWDDTYRVEGVLGICFELEESDINQDWDEETTKIEYISVFEE
jgi:hypothetical protein